MPKVQSGKKYSKAYSEASLEKALEAIKNGMGKKTAARTYNIPRATLQFRLSKEFVKSRPGPDTVLSSQEESDLAKWIVESSRKGFPRRKEDVIKSVKLFLDQNPRPNSFIDNTPGGGWYKLFLRRHQNLSIRTSEAVTTASSKVSESQIRNWFRHIENYLKENDLFHILSDPSRVYNGDETNFILCPKNTKVIAPKGEKNVYEVDHAQSKSCITVMFTFAADGETTPPMIIFPLKRMRPDIQKSVPKLWGIGLSDNGWMKAELFYQYVQNVLHPALQKKKVVFPIILFVDGHKSHTTLQLSQLCQNLGIILIALYPNATRLLQPADVAAFRPIKIMWRKAVLEWRTNNLTKTLLKTDVGPILDKLLSKIKKSTLKNGFEACGLCPFNPDIVDYTKCLMASKPQQAILNDNSTIDMNYQTFQEIVGAQLIRKMKNQIVGKSVEAKKLFEIYKYLVPKLSMQSSSNSIITEDQKSEHRLQTLSNDLGSDILAINDSTADSNGNATSSGPTAYEILEHHTITPETQVTNEVEITTTELKTCFTQSFSSIPKPEDSVEIIYDSQKENEPSDVPTEAQSTHFVDIPSTSRQNIEFIDGNWVLVYDVTSKNLSNSPEKNKLKDFLHLPKTPIKKENANKQHRSFVLTSKAWEAAELEKQQNKLELIKQKEAKRKARLEKAALKRSTKEEKQIENQNKKNKAKCPYLVKKSKPKTNTAVDSNTDKPKIIITSNILLKSANNTLEKTEGITELQNFEKKIDSQLTIVQEQHREPLSLKYHENIPEKSKNEENSEYNCIYIDKQKHSSTKYIDNNKEKPKKSEEDRRYTEPTKPLSVEEILRILEED